MNQLSVLPEPLIEFRYGQKVHDPHDGLSLFGPYDTDLPSHKKSITYGVLGTKEGIDFFNRWSEKMNGPILTDRDKNKKIWPDFPGFDVAFESSWPKNSSWTYEINRNELLNCTLLKDHYKRTSAVVDKYLEGIKLTQKRDESFDVLVCIVPDEVWLNCRYKSKVSRGIGYKPSKKEINGRRRGQKSLYDFGETGIDDSEKWTVEIYNYSLDFRRQIKARSMAYSIPIQIIRESTLVLDDKQKDKKRGLTQLSDRAWNLSTALYYKAGGKPWKLFTARKGVCYIGISFKKIKPAEKDTTACCAAQMFLDSGDGIVFLGDEGPWYSPLEKQYHLDKDSAKKLLEGILTTYGEMKGEKLEEIFLHSRSIISNEEFSGYKEACPDNVKLVGVRVRPTSRFELKLYRPGRMPVIRGTYLKINDKSSYLWGTGFKSRLETYDGSEVPIPLRIDLQHGDSNIDQVTSDIFGLTKLNYNACKLGYSQPVTIGFSNAVGEILVSNPYVEHTSPNFKFYI